MKRNDTAIQLLDAAQLLIMERGYNAFSYKDLAEKIQIRTASIHYHFPSKGDLGLALMNRYLDRLQEALEIIDRSAKTNRGKMKSFIDLYAETESQGAICLCGSLASDCETLPPPLQTAISDYIALSEKWVTKILEAGIEEGEFYDSLKPSDAATHLLSSLQGGLILSRVQSRRSSLLSSVQRAFFDSIDAA